MNSIAINVVTDCIVICLYSSQETEYWFGEVYIPLGILCPYSKHFVSEDDKSGSLNVTKSFERNLTMPIEPKVLIGSIYRVCDCINYRV